MPRIRKRKTTVAKRKITDSFYYIRNVFSWVDPFPEVHGTRPEKMVYAFLTEMGIPFYFLNDLTFSDSSIDFLKEYQADFYLPEAKVIIEVQGAFWHSKPATIEADAFKMAIYESFGYTVYTWWDYEIETDLIGLFAQSNILINLHRGRNTIGQSKELLPIKRTKIDTSKGIRTLNSKRKKYNYFVGTSRRNLRKVKSSYGTK